MPQDRSSGSEAAKWGREAGKRLGLALGGSATSRLANEFLLQGRRVAVKTAKERTRSVGVTYLVLDRVDDVYAGWEVSPNTFQVWSLPAPLFRSNMRPTASQGPSSGRVGLVSRMTFERFGHRVGTVQLN
jgi:hypothetical protein